ncbi:hypothetical protein [Prauserella flavalba]|uniref:hypothetical protein n=1 Tax=Prauserella flavalba TaxID=1477506 RepID=UPI0036E66E8E
MPSIKYRVVGTRTVCGVAPGGTVELDEDKTSLNVGALVEAGHLAKATRRGTSADDEKGNDSR